MAEHTPLEPYIVDCETHFSACRHTRFGGGGVEWLSAKHGWLAAIKENVRFYSRFKTEAAAKAAIAKATNEKEKT